MNTRFFGLAGLFAALGLCYVLFFTDWLNPEPIQIASQVRTSILQPHFGRGVLKTVRTNAETGEVVTVLHTNAASANEKARRARLPEWGEIGEAPGNVANVTFTLDAPYELTRLMVQDVPTDGSLPRVLWDLVGRSVPTSSLLYGRMPKGMKPATPESELVPLTPGVPYRLVVEAGRRKGVHAFTTRP